MRRISSKLFKTVIAFTLSACAATEVQKAPSDTSTRSYDGDAVTGTGAEAEESAPSADVSAVISEPRAPSPDPSPPPKQVMSKKKEVAGPAGLATTTPTPTVPRPQQHVAQKPMEPPPPPPPVSAPNSINGTFVHAGTNPYIATNVEPTSTFAVDVDTGSFMLARRFLRQGQLPHDASVRVEEWINAMHYSYQGPTKKDDQPFAVLVDGAPSPIAKGKHVVRVALQGKRVSKEERGPTHLVFLVDVSGSMDSHDKLPLARESLHMLTDNLRDDDSVAIVTYAGATGVVLPTTRAKDRGRIHSAIDKLHAGGGTNMGSGMELAYREAAKHLGGGRSARVIVVSDGDANIGRTSHQSILQSVKGYVSEGVMMSTIGMGTGNYNDHLMEQLANAGNGVYSYIGDKAAAKRFFVDELQSTLETIAQDVKIQVEWNPSVVSHYRLIGYENRHMENKDFRDDKKDAGEIGSGHAVTALYELQLTTTAPREALGTVRVRSKVPRGSKASELAVSIPADMLKERPGDLDHDALTAAATALAAEILRRSPYAEGRTLSEAAAMLREAAMGPHAQERLELARDLMRVEPALAHR